MYVIHIFIFNTYFYTLVEAVETDTDVEADDSELADSGDPGLLIFLRFRGRPFNFGARIF